MRTGSATAIVALYHVFEKLVGADAISISRKISPEVKEQIKHDICIGDLCTPDNKTRVSKAFLQQPTLYLERPNLYSFGTKPGSHFQEMDDMFKELIGSDDAAIDKDDIEAVCSDPLKEEDRIMLMPVVPQFHGSTALEGVFMSSPKVTTLCKADVWQCEAHFIYEAKGENLKDATDMLWEYSNLWNLSMPIFLDKGPRDLKKIYWEHAELDKERLAGLPNPMKWKGISTLTFVYVLMWRPVCLSILSHNARNVIEADPKGFAMSELTLLEEMVEAHKYLSGKGYRLVVLSLGDLIWKPERTQERLQTFLPCLGDLDFDWTPTLFKDVWPGNKWKSNGSVKKYGEATSPWDCCRYQISEQKCYGETDYFAKLDTLDQKRAYEAQDYMLMLS